MHHRALGPKMTSKPHVGPIYGNYVSETNPIFIHNQEIINPQRW